MRSTATNTKAQTRLARLTRSPLLVPALLFAVIAYIEWQRGPL